MGDDDLRSWLSLVQRDMTDSLDAPTNSLGTQRHGKIQAETTAPAIADYGDRVVARPAFARAQEKDATSS